MKMINFIKKQLNFSKKWVVAVSATRGVFPCEALVSRLMTNHGYGRRELNKLMQCVKDEVMSELLKGNSVDLFGIVKVRPDYTLKKSIYGNEEELNELIPTLTQRDVKTMLHVNANQTFNHEYVRRAKGGVKVESKK